MDKGWPVRFACTAVVALLGLSGCYEPEPHPHIIGADNPVNLPAVEAVPRYHVLGRSVQGRPILAQVLGDGADTTLFMATIHGNEPAGTPVMERLAHHLNDHPDLLQDRRVVIIGVANPDGMAAGTRTNIRGVDLNRNFDTNNRVNNQTHGSTGLTEPESRAIHAAIQEFHPDRIVTLHQPLTCIDYDGPGKELAARMARFCALPVKKLGARPGSLGSYTGEELGIPTITVEMPAGASQLSDAVLWNQYGQAMLSAVTYSTQLSK